MSVLQEILGDSIPVLCGAGLVSAIIMLQKHRYGLPVRRTKRRQELGSDPWHRWDHRKVSPQEHAILHALEFNTENLSGTDWDDLKKRGIASADTLVMLHALYVYGWAERIKTTAPGRYEWWLNQRGMHKLHQLVLEGKYLCN
jgi:hypothetical protein